ncbi:MAG: DUF2497 domain-containing protein [Bauldia sp.]|nr:MAG: DUF2497 domain-containing protein [Bauldia sp.]
MAQTGSAQREPSMEEILASIRRIIEDSDTARRPLEEENGTPELSAAPLAAPEVQHPEIQHEVEAFRAELDDAAAVQPAVSRRHEPAAAEPVHSSSPEPAVSSDPHESLDPREDEAPQAHAPAVPIFEEHLRESVAHLRPVTPASVEAAPAEAASTEIRPSLISDHAGRQVAAAFGELSEAFAASRRRSFDEVAEEMLRPMLQEWLDNNLPTLVERLVREEIERVARGG